MAWLDNNCRDRDKGDRAERQAFVNICAEGLRARRHPYGSTGHDIVVYYDDEEHPVEVRCKNPDKRGRYGLEQPKYQQWRDANVIYLIKDWELGEWRWARVRELPEPTPGKPGSYHAGGVDSGRVNDYWPIHHWSQLSWGYVA